MARIVDLSKSIYDNPEDPLIRYKPSMAPTRVWACIFKLSASRTTVRTIARVEVDRIGCTPKNLEDQHLRRVITPGRYT